MIVKKLLRFLEALKSATIKEMKDIGLRDEVRELIDALGRLAGSAQSAERRSAGKDGNIDNRTWVKLWTRLAVLRAALRED